MSNRLALLVLFGTATVVSAQPKNKPLPAKLVTFSKAKLSLNAALKTIAAQSKIEVVGPDGINPMLTFSGAERPNKTPFWQALDRVARAADLRVSLYRRDGKPGLVEHRRGWRQLPVSYDGPFRVVLKRLTQIRDLEDGVSFGSARLEVAWEPGFQAFVMSTNPKDMKVTAGGVPIDVPPIKGGGMISTGMAKEIEIPLPGIRRPLTRIDRLEGTVTMIGAPRMLDAIFDQIKQDAEKKIDGVSIKLTGVKLGKTLWTIDVTLTYPPGGPKFESFQSWLVNNRCYLINKKQQRLDNAGFESDPISSNKAFMRYRFVDEGDLKLGNAGWRLVYHTPARIVEVPVKFSFRDVPLP